MDNGAAKKGDNILAGDELKIVRGSDDLALVRGLTRRNFMQCCVGTVASLCLWTLNTGCNDSDGGNQIAFYPIDPNVVTTTTRVLSFPIPPQPAGPDSGTGLYLTELPLINQYKKYGYGDWTYSKKGLEIKQRFDLMPDSFAATAASLTRLEQFAHFFTMSDIHITDKEAPNQLIYLQQENPAYSGTNTSIYSPIMTCTTHVLDAAIQTINALHDKKAFDFGISLGDTCNSTSYNELRWYMGVFDGEIITPSSGAHRGADSIDYQRPFAAAGLNKSIRWYQALGNHDHFLLGSFPVDADPSLGLRESYISDTVWAVPNALLTPNFKNFPVLIDMENFKATPQYYCGVLDGSTKTGKIIATGAAGEVSAPTVAADPNRRSLLRTEWIQEFFKTSTLPVGHGFNLVDPTKPEGFACYSFVPNPDVPLKIIVLDDTQSEADGSTDIHGHGFLDETRWGWLQDELAAGHDADQLMIIAAHIPIGVGSIGSELEWWESDKDPNATEQNAVSLTELVETLWETPNLIAWIAGHRHYNTVKAFVSPDREIAPEKGFWQVETSSLRDHPQQFRTFEIYLNSDYTVSIVTVNVDPSVAEGTPAAKSRYYSIATQQIVQNNIMPNNPNIKVAYDVFEVETMDPSRPQDGSLDKTIIYGSVPDVPFCASYNAELFKQLSPTMIRALMEKFPANT